MDPISQGAIGAALPQALQNSEEFYQRAKTVTWVGCLAGMSPDLDVFIRSPTDPLLFLEFHRQFTHSLFFIPIGALICALAFSRFAKPTLDFKQTYLVCFFAYCTHAMLDACTSYGTQLLWPLTNHRFAFNNIAVVDPFATIPLVACVISAVVWRKVLIARLGLAWFLFYLGMGFVQQNRALGVAETLAAQRGHGEAEISIKAGFGNILLWKSIYTVDDVYYVDAVRVGIGAKIYEGTSIEKLDVERDLPWLDRDSQQGVDLERFRWFSKDYLAIDPERANLVIDLRYSMLPNEVNSLWGIGLRIDATPSDHVTFEADRDATPERREIFLAMLMGDSCIPQSTGRDSSESSQNCAIEL
jgi:inner membrane protein